MYSQYFLLLTFLLCIASIYDAQAQFVSGTVFEDKNKNGIQDKSEAGIPDVLVSNQIQVVRTDKYGRYNLPIRNEMIIFITKPSDYELPLNEVNLPQFYYIHQPNGSPDGLNFEGIAPTGRIPDSIDFALYNTEKKRSFNVIVVGDPQPRDSVEVGYYRDDIVAEMYGTNAEFYIALGDIAFDNLNIYRQYNQIVGTLGMPAFNVHGNHDMNFKVPDDLYAAETFKRIYGPTDYSFDYGSVHFIVLDNIAYNGWNYEENNKGGYRGFINEQQLTWLRNDLSFVPADHLVVICTHIPIVSTLSDAGGINVVNRTALFDVLKHRKNLLALSAHMHYIEHLTFNASVDWESQNPFYSINVGAGCGAWWSGPKDDRGIPESHCLDGTPNGYYIFRFEDNTYNFTYVPSKFQDSKQLRISFPSGMIAADSLSGKDIVVNVFNADPDATVRYRIDDREAVMMKQQRMTDPFIDDYVSHREFFPGWINSAVENTHIWTSPMPLNLDSGTHTIRVEAVDSKRNVYYDISIFNIE